VVDETVADDAGADDDDLGRGGDGGHGCSKEVGPAEPVVASCATC
jgi:hypothetical protein